MKKFLILLLTVASAFSAEPPNSIPFQQADAGGKYKSKQLPADSTAFVTQLGGPFLPLTGGNMTGNIAFGTAGQGNFFNGGGNITGTTGNVTISGNGSSKVVNISNAMLSVGQTSPQYGFTLEGTANTVASQARIVASSVCSLYLAANATGSQLGTDFGDVILKIGVTPGSSATTTGTERFRATSSGATVTGNLTVTANSTVGGSFRVGATGTFYSKMYFGTNSALVGGTVTITDTAVTANTKLIPLLITPGGTGGALFISAKSVGASVTVTSTSATDTSTVSYIAIEP